MGEKKRDGDGRKGRGAVPPATGSCCSGCLQVRRPAGGARQGLLLVAGKHGRRSEMDGGWLGAETKGESGGGVGIWWRLDRLGLGLDGLNSKRVLVRGNQTL